MPMSRENQDVVTVKKKPSRSHNFRFYYLAQCRALNIRPLECIRNSEKSNKELDIFADKLDVNDWKLITKSLHNDVVLHTIIIRTRRSTNNIVIPIDNENKAKLFDEKPAVFTRYVFKMLVESIGNCVRYSKKLTVLKLQGLPLRDGYIDCIAKSFAYNEGLKELSFHKSYIGDNGCAAICSMVKHLRFIETVDLSYCDITPKGAEHVAAMIKTQTLNGYSKGWESSLRYRSVEVDGLLGLRNICLANNPGLGDEGLSKIAEVLKDDVWVKSINMESCGLTDSGANCILQCLELNKAITDFNISNNSGICKVLQRQVADKLGKEVKEIQNEPQYDLSCVSGLQSLPKNQKYSISQLLTHIKGMEEQVSFERTVRCKVEKMNEKLNQSLASHFHNQHNMNAGAMTEDKFTVPEGHVLLNYEQLSNFLTQGYKPTQEQITQLINSAVHSLEGSPRSNQTTIRNQESAYSEIDEGEETVDEDQQPRQVIKVRKVRSEMKYVESFSKEKAKKRESKSDHEFANERHFKLNSKVRFETNIGDGSLVSQQRERVRSNSRAAMSSKYGQELVSESIGDGIQVNRQIKKKEIKAGTNKFMEELERQIGGNSDRSRHKHKRNSRETMKVPSRINENPTTMMQTMVDTSDNLYDDELSSGSDDEQSYGQRYARQDEDLEESDGETDDTLQDVNNSDSETISPRSVYTELLNKSKHTRH